MVMDLMPLVDKQEKSLGMTAIQGCVGRVRAAMALQLHIIAVALRCIVLRCVALCLLSETS